jgi:DNA (cytosine-5)-methyltransferase 1
MSLTYTSICSGIEAPGAAWGPIGWTPLWFSEIKPFPCAVLKHHYPDTPNLGDMTALDFVDRAAAIGIPDVLIAGCPCQAFSVAGRRESLDDDRGNLTLRFCIIVEGLTQHAARLDRHGPVIVFENVPGILNTKDNAFGCLLAGLVGEDSALIAPGGRWTDAGMVAGPRGNLAWAVLDAQHFGLAQRRERVFVVFCPGGRADSSKILLEPKSLCGDSSPRRQAGQDVAGTLAARAGAGGGLGTDFELGGGGLQPSACAGGPTPATGRTATTMSLAFGGGNQGGAIDVSTALNAKERIDFDSETFIAHTLRGDGFDASEDGTGRGVPLVPVAFSCKDHGADAGDVAPTLRSMGHDASHANGGGQVAVCFESRFARNGRGAPSEIAPPLKAQSGQTGKGDAAPLVHAAMAVRRLTPTECERLQGFPDGWTLIPLGKRNKKAERKELSEFADRTGQDDIKWSADGPRYKALGNSMAVPVIRWIGRKIQQALESSHDSA